MWEAIFAEQLIAEVYVTYNIADNINVPVTGKSFLDESP